jgi:hypothetical protein
MINTDVVHGGGTPNYSNALGSTSMIIYLYLKTHNLTGLKYLGKTEMADPIAYQGSGLIWCRHIKKYGYDVTTEILRECKNQDEVKEWGLYYSDLWNVVESPDFANLKPECGNGGPVGPEGAKKISQKIKAIRNDPNWKATIGSDAFNRMMETRNTVEWQETIGKEASRKHSDTLNNPEWIATVGLVKASKVSTKAKVRKNDPVWRATKGLEAREKEKITKSDPDWLATTGAAQREKMKAKRNSEEYKEAQYKECPHCKKVADPGNYKQYHGDNCAVVNPAAKRRHKQLTCPHCNKTGGISAMKRYHFDNCKQKG